MLTECYSRSSETVKIDGVWQEINTYRRCMAGMVENHTYGFMYMGTMPNGWEPSPTDLVMHDVPGNDNFDDTLGYVRFGESSIVNGTVTYFNVYFFGMLNRTVTRSFNVDEFEFMPDGWEPVPGVHKILWEDVKDENIYE